MLQIPKSALSNIKIELVLSMLKQESLPILSELLRKAIPQIVLAKLTPLNFTNSVATLKSLFEQLGPDLLLEVINHAQPLVKSFREMLISLS